LHSSCFISFSGLSACSLYTLWKDGFSFFIIKPKRYTSFPNLLRHEILHVSDSSSAHHQEFTHCTLGIDICHTRLKTAFEQDQDVPSCTNFPNLLRHETAHVSGSSSAHHQEFIRCTLGTGICHTGLKPASRRTGMEHPGPGRKLSSNLYDIYQCLVYSE